MRRPLAALFVCSVSGLVAGCGGDDKAPPGSISPPGPPPATLNFSMQFFGTGKGDIDRVKIPLLNPNGTTRPVNVGATDFTLEFWLKGAKLDNPSVPCTAGAIGKDAWTSGAVVIDRDVLGDGDFGEFGVALFGGQVAFGVNRSSGGQTVCGARDVLDGAWHHVALTRERSTGTMTIFVDGGLDRSVLDPGASQDVDYNPAHANPGANDPFLVLGAEKFDVTGALAFHGLLDELRLSIGLRYLGTFSRPTGAFTPDGNTAALYHFDESSGTVVTDASNGNASPGVLIPAASGAASHRSTDTPF